MASRKEATVTPMGQKKTVVTRKLPFLRPGEDSNISPSKFERVLQYFSEEELEDETIEEEGDDVVESDADSDYIASSSDSSVHSDTEEEEFQDDVDDVDDDNDNGGDRGARGGRKRKRGIGTRVRKRVIVP